MINTFTTNIVIDQLHFIALGLGFLVVRYFYMYLAYRNKSKIDKTAPRLIDRIDKEIKAESLHETLDLTIEEMDRDMDLMKGSIAHINTSYEFYGAASFCFIYFIIHNIFQNI